MSIQSNLCQRLNLKPAELMMLSVATSALIIDLLLIIYKGAQVDSLAYAGLFALTLFLITVGMVYRISKRSERIASALICTGAFLFFSACLSLFNYLLLPISRPLIDVPIAAIDAMFGYHWPDIMHLAAENLFISNIMKVAYLSTIPQFAMLVVVLGLTGRTRDLHVLIASITITATITICFWGLFPTLGSTTMYVLPPEIWATVNPAVDEAYALELMRVAEHGPGVISPKEIRGLIGFPSYHAVLAFTAIYAARNVRFLSTIFLIINLLILPGLFIHGGHHFLDLFGGLAVFLFGTLLATRSIQDDTRQTVNGTDQEARSGAIGK